MMYVEFMKNFLFPDSSELMAVRLILASWAQKRLIPSFYTCSSSRSWKIFFSPIAASSYLLDSFWHAEPKNKWFLLCRHDVRRVHEKFCSCRFERADGVTLILASWAQKRLIPSFYTCSASRSWKIFFSPIGASSYLLDSFWHAEPKNKWFLLCRHDVRRLHEKFSSRRFERADGC